ncbi:tRNA (adenosine(37)-N6)-threonylcarbamoyltransferase complex ATPase subunit type 1 TsaE [uncultured Eubacterium sp.]|uniref:tRNA (adenosine(37)-N6)-threonylcarbamoyltransferase complex ATPase subunit type 1 TsaE n=1 Tax=uncultured Eubacterium sp. TaxID=165185 RepID=UPI00262F77FD|nr:tRNA (adenosine(37)-N6)-threonylcarbamoyltransferase complex ATPase subunit type 1 TsaE [uncultured Eubacterium sp.]
MIEFVSTSYEDTFKKAESFAKTCKKGTVIGFFGGLGMGKTAFTSGFVKGLGINADVSSPTFAICNEYIGDNDKVYHFDMYRIDSWDDLYSTGFFDFLETDAYIIAEWSENIFGALPDDAVIIEIEKLGENERHFVIKHKYDYKEED